MNIILDRKKKFIEIDMSDTLMETIKYFGEDVDDTVASPTRKNIFEVNNDSPELDERRRKIFHSVMAKLIFIMKRGRPDLETPMSFLMKRVSKSNEEDWNTLKRCFLASERGILRTRG